MTELPAPLTPVFDAGTRVFRAPGRVNLIGEHTDYNGGLVMPVAINFATWVAVSPAAGRSIQVESRNLHESFDFDLDEPGQPRQAWIDYVRGVAVMLERSGIRLPGARLVIESNVPLSAGLSSSAALEVATAYALLAQTDVVPEPSKIALICQGAENEFVGVRCGIMDQFTSCCAREGQALVLNCRTLAATYFPLPASARLVICNTMVRHALASGAYNQRRAECEEAARRLGVVLLGNLSLAEFQRCAAELPEVIRRRARHVVTENARVEQAAPALARGDLDEFGKAMNESHRSLRDDFEVSCAELDLMVELAREQPGVYGARMTGGGFGGCTINLVREDAVENFLAQVPAAYFAKTASKPAIYVCSAAAGAGEVINGAD
jgi:galactokinase